MTDRDVTHDGECRCGQVRFRVKGVADPHHGLSLHRLPTDDGERLFAERSVSEPNFEVVQGEPVIGGLHGATRHFFCPHCMSWLFTRPEGLDGFVNVRTVMLEDPSRFPPYVEMYTGERLPWAETPAVHSFETDPSDERFMELVAEFAEQAALRVEGTSHPPHE